MSLLARARAGLAHRRWPFLLAAFATVISLPEIGQGFALDDYVLRAVGLGRAQEVGISGAPADMFTFNSDAPGAALREMDTGWAPWWRAPDLRIHFFRPLSSLSHYLDLRLGADAAVPMHLENVALYAALVVAAAVFYRRVLGRGWAAGLAALFYALDPGHAQSVGFICGRNTVLAALFGISCLVAHDRARRDGFRAGLPLSTALFAASLLSGESGLSTALYLLSHAIFLDPETRWARRTRALAPYALVGLAWVVAYRLFDYGARGSTMYTDPGSAPLVYLRQAVVRAPIFLAGSIGLPLASFFAALSSRGTLVFGALSAVFCLLFARAVWSLPRAEDRFLAMGAVLSLLPIAAIIPNDRVLFFVGLGGLGLAARVVEVFTHRALAVFLLIVHLPLALAFHLFSAQTVRLLAGTSRAPLDEILLEPEVAHQTVIFVNAPAHFLISHLSAMRLGTDKPIPARWRCLAPGIYPLTLTRDDDRSLTVRVEGGMLPFPGTRGNATVEPPPLDPSYGGQHFAALVRRADDPLRAGDTIVLTGMTVVVREVSAAAGPTAVRFTFAEPLESPSLRWLAWQAGHYLLFAPPPVGETVKLAAASMLPP
jgi:hypothetical protein